MTRTLAILAAVVAILLAGVPVAAAGAADRRLERDARRLIRSRLPSGTTAVFVADLETGDPHLEIEPDEPLNPASNVKLISTATALAMLGADYRYTTRVLGDVPDDDGRARGDLYLFGSHDPTLDRGALADLATQLRDLGMTSLDGDVVVGPRLRDGVGRAVIDVSIDARARRGQRATVSDLDDFVVIEDRVAVTRGRTRLTVEARLDDDASPRLHVEVHGKVKRKTRTTRRVAVPEPAILAAHLLREELLRAGIEVHGSVRVESVRDYVVGSLDHGFLAVPLAEHESASLGEIIAAINKRSINWLADGLLRSVVVRRSGGRATMERGLDAMHAWLRERAALDDTDVVLDTGSGLSYETRLTARQVVEILRASVDDPAYRDSLAIGGVDGTLAHRLPRLSTRVRGKTGTLTGIIALSGTLELADGREVVFSIITNGHRPGKRTAVRRAHEKLLRLLARRLDAQTS